MNNYSQNNNFCKFKESLITTCEDSFLKTVPTDKINDIVKKEHPSDIEEIFDKYNKLKNKIDTFLNKMN